MCDEHKSSIAWELDEEDRPTWWIRDAHSGECFYADSNHKTPPEWQWFDQHGEPTKVQVRLIKEDPLSSKDGVKKPASSMKPASSTEPENHKSGDVNRSVNEDEPDSSKEPSGQKDRPRRQVERKHGFIQQVI